MTNYLGQTVLKTQYTAAIDVSKLTNGIYTLKILSETGNVYRSRFIKQ